jgi:hypothetical protein
MALAIAYQGLGAARKRDLANAAFQNLGWANDELATISSFAIEGSERARILRERWRN